jgi:ribulose kinase
LCPDFFVHRNRNADEVDGRRLLMTGGATRSRAIVQVYADVFGRPVTCMEVPDAAAYGAAVRAVHAVGSASTEDLLSNMSHVTSSGSTILPSLGSQTVVAQNFYAACEAAGQMVERKVMKENATSLMKAESVERPVSDPSS